jgi:hypothetical protein
VLDRLRRVPLLGLGLVRLTDIVVTRELVGPPPGLKAGRFVPAKVADELPVSLVVMPGGDAESVSLMIRTIAEQQMLVGGFKPVFLIDHAAFVPFRSAGYVVEHLVPRAEWARRPWSTPWGDYVAVRVAQCRSTYQPDVTVILPPGAVVDRELLGALLGPAARSRRSAAGTRLRGLFRRAARWADRPL